MDLLTTIAVSMLPVSRLKAAAAFKELHGSDPGVSLGVYARVLQALSLDADLAHIARDDELGRRLQDLGLKQPRRAPRKKAGAPS